jgi:hypothetical protein
LFPESWNHAINATKAGAGLGALTWLLFIITLVVFGMFFQQRLGDQKVANGYLKVAPCSNIALRTVLQASVSGVQLLDQ